MLGFGFVPPDDALRVLCLGAHADDIEIGCGGTLLRLIAEVPRLSLRWVVFSGEGGRRQEAEASAQHFLAGVGDAEARVLGFRDGFFPSEHAAIKETFEWLKREFQPSLILTHYREDLHQDHRLISELTYNTYRDHLVWEYEVPKYDGDLGNPNLFAPLSEAQCRRKVAALIEHFPSQRSRSWFTTDTFMALLRLRGIGCNAASGYAEAFYCRKAVV
jgi:LmbE family N-acetylglucosaminyl deacetylase